MKKVFHFVSTKILSGAENIVINICTLLKNKGYKFVYVSPSGPINFYLHKYHIQHICINKMNPITVRRVIKKFRPNIVQGHDVKASLCLAMNFYLCRKNDIMIISQLHNDDPRMHMYSVRSILYMISSFAYDHIIVVYNDVINNYIFKNIVRNKVTVINNIVNPYRIKKYPSSHKKWDCIFIGRFVDQKDPIRFVRIIYYLNKKMGHISAVMLGTGPLVSSVKWYIKQYNLSANIDLIGFKRNPYKYLFLSKILIMPSKYEGLSLTALESLLCGIPIIASNVSGFLRIINDKCGYLANDIDEFVRKSYIIINNPKIYDYKSKNSIKQGDKINSIKTFINSYKEIYDEE